MFDCEIFLDFRPVAIVVSNDWTQDCCLFSYISCIPLRCTVCNTDTARFIIFCYVKLSCCCYHSQKKVQLLYSFGDCTVTGDIHTFFLLKEASCNHVHDIMRKLALLYFFAGLYSIVTVTYERRWMMYNQSIRLQHHHNQNVKSNHSYEHSFHFISSSVCSGLLVSRTICC